ncbi:ATP-binding cassette domain-containing protein [Vagococcus sp. DIV0080]|uniref:ATP-binding cassette domain-containing protein n=1 Tax=Candidatus Vagococcus giribetii TaxID=2230876 RepID=A0ABS3HRJ1_9ENTE|nr:ATP-binding cassette domain-containing protein [Vagococcus sp. DIV0080]MBO0475925.1 ATP-binding cassette domain-containing protein [Vagococcus sp. DIV0080]
MNDTFLSIKNLHFSTEEKCILSDISFDVKKGELITISGPSGSGKSTLLKLIATMIPKTSGEIIFKEKKIEDYSPTDYRKDVSYFFQNPVLFGETVKDNLIFPYEIRNLTFDESRAITLLESVQLDKSFIDKKVTDLSGGEKQRVAFVRNLLFPPELLLLDEVTSALDEENSRIIKEMIVKLNQEDHLTVLWVTHDKSEFLSSPRQLVIEEGRLKEDTHE